MTDFRRPLIVPCRDASWNLSGEVGARVTAAIEQWILPLPYANPGLLEMFRERDLQPARDRCPWEGEYAGKYLTHCVQIYRLTRDDRLRRHLEWFVHELRSLQAADGYLGPWPPGSRLTGSAPNSRIRSSGMDDPLPTWDAWGHYHVMFGLLLWHMESGDDGTLDCVRRIADLMCSTYLNGTRLYATSPGCEEMNMACLHGLCLLYRQIPNPEYLRLIQQIEADLQQPQCGDYIRVALEGKEFYQGRKPRWESLHVIQGIGELYYLTGDERYRDAFENIWWSIVRNDRHNNGGFSSGEQASGNPYDDGAIETCCTIAWLALSVDMLKLTGNPVVADEIELSLLNSGLGFLSRSGRWCTYNTPMEGSRGAFVVDHNWQAQPGAPELNCCAVNAPRSLGLIGEWGLMEDAGGLAINYFGDCAVHTRTPAGNAIRVAQETDYPASGRIEIAIEPKAPESFTLRLRVPQWSHETRLALNGSPLTSPRAGAYAAIERRWCAGDRVTLELDLSLHYWVGERDRAGRSSVYRGPILLAHDPRLSADADARPPRFDAARMDESRSSFAGWLRPWLHYQYASGPGDIALCDFASAGATGTPYRTWFQVDNVERAAFSATNTFRSSRPE